MFANYTLANKLHFLAIIIILIVLTLSWLFPRQSSVSESTVGKLNELVTLMNNVNNNVNTAMAEQKKINQALLSNYNKREEFNANAYDDLLKKYGIEEPIKSEGTPNEKTVITRDNKAIKNADSYDKLLDLHGCVDGVCK
ncbi:hypothetical protein [Shewanella phage FishSpeaker]|nr:hypothetical protein [Shewanella phage FishSpeaker]